MPDETPSPELISAQRDQVFEEIERQADLAASYARSIGEAAFRGDQVTIIVHLRQLRECLLAMFATQKDFLQSSKNDTRGPP
jgi:hypothetical protein